MKFSERAMRTPWKRKPQAAGARFWRYAPFVRLPSRRRRREDHRIALDAAHGILILALITFVVLGTYAGIWWLLR